MKINLILLASGYSRRFNGNKLLSDYKGKKLYMHIFEKISNIRERFNNVIVVTQYDEIYNSAVSLKFDALLNTESFKGLSGSISIGITKDMRADGYMFMVCDQPDINEMTIINLVDKFIEGKNGICSISFNGKLYNPNIFSNKYIEDLLSLNGDIGGKNIIKDNMDDVAVIYLDSEQEIKDIDRQEDLQNQYE